jgi:two-component system sporulation sensor kinase A
MGLWWHQGALVAGWDGRGFPAYAVLVGLVQLLAVAGLAAQAIELPRPLVAEVAEQAALIERQGHRAELGTSLAMMAHEIRTPLTTVGFGLHAALDQLKAPEGPGSTRALRHLQAADQELDRLSRMLEGLLSYARDRRGRMRLEPHRPVALFNRAVEFARLKWARSQRSFETRAATETPRGVRCDVDAMHQVLVNILDNAIQRQDPGRPLKIDMSAREEGSQVALIVRDTGAGGGDPDAGSSGARPEANRGDGIGITIAKRLVEEQGGRFAIESAPGGETTCTVWLPSVRIAPPGAEAA